MLATNRLVVTIVFYSEWVQDSNFESNNKTKFLFYFMFFKKKPDACLSMQNYVEHVHNHTKLCFSFHEL